MLRASLPALSSESVHWHVTAINQRPVGGAVRAAGEPGCLVQTQTLAFPPGDSLAPIRLRRVGRGHLQTRNARPQRSISSTCCLPPAQQFNLSGGKGNDGWPLWSQCWPLVKNRLPGCDKNPAERAFTILQAVIAEAEVAWHTDVSLGLERERVQNIQKITYSHFFILQDSEKADDVGRWKSSYKCTSDWAISNDPDKGEMGNVPHEPSDGWTSFLKTPKHHIFSSNI